MIRRLRNRSRLDFSERENNTGEWLSSDAGTILVDSEKQLLEQELTTIFGYHACQYSAVPEADLLKNTAVKSRFTISTSTGHETSVSQMQINPDHWPVAPGSLDLVLLHHTLEAAENPHQLLSEAANTIIPEGKLIIIGFNPFSLGGLARWVMPGHWPLLRSTRLITPWRLRDWLKLLRFRVERTGYGGYLYPVSGIMSGLKGKLVEQRCDHLHLPLGGFYIMVASPETPGMIPIRKPWGRVRPGIVGHSVPRPSTRSPKTD